MATLTQMKRGLSQRHTYDEVLSLYLSGSPDIKRPNRTASFIRESPQYQTLLKNDFIDLQKQQNDMLQAQRRQILIKEQASQTDSDIKSIIASKSPSQSEVSQQVQSDLSAVSAHGAEYNTLYNSNEDFVKELQAVEDAKKVTGEQLIKDGLGEVTKQHEYLGGLRDALDESETVEKQEAASSSSGAVHFDISDSPKVTPPSTQRGRSTSTSRRSTSRRETSRRSTSINETGKPATLGRPINLNSKRQMALAHQRELEEAKAEKALAKKNEL